MIAGLARKGCETVATWAWRTGRLGLDLLLPPQCLTCDTPVDTPGQFCPPCFRLAGFVTEPCCTCCGVPFAHAGQGGAGQGGAAQGRTGRGREGQSRFGLCPGCIAAPPHFDQARAALRYDTQARRLILPFKHGDRVEVALGLVPHLLRAGSALLRTADVLVPVPLHRTRLWQRRYNQAGLLAQAVARAASRPVLPDALLRRRPTASLGGQTAAERRAELAEAFAVRPSRAARIAGACVLLVDDVMTSGATASGCAAVLKAAGAVRVDVLVAARVPDPRLA